jgi:DNA-binding transcriptional MerR regulator
MARGILASVYKIGSVSKATGLSAATLRSWEVHHGLLTPQRTPGGTRLYSDDDIERARYFRMLVRERGYSLNALAAAVVATPGGRPTEADFDSLLRRLVRAEPGWPATVAFLDGVKAMTEMTMATIGLYLRWRDAVFFAVTVRPGRARQFGGTPIAVSEFPLPWQQAIHALQPCFHPDLLRLKLPGSLTAWVRQTRTRSFYAEPLAVGRKLVGVLMIGSPTAAGISRRAQEICARLAVPAGPAISLFAAQF